MLLSKGKVVRNLVRQRHITAKAEHSHVKFCEATLSIAKAKLDQSLQGKGAASTRVAEQRQSYAGQCTAKAQLIAAVQSFVKAARRVHILQSKGKSTLGAARSRKGKVRYRTAGQRKGDAMLNSAQQRQSGLLLGKTGTSKGKVSLYKTKQSKGRVELRAAEQGQGWIKYGATVQGEAMALDFEKRNIE